MFWFSRIDRRERCCADILQLSLVTRFSAPLILMLFLAACDSSGSGGYGWCTSDDPVISNLGLTPDSAIVGEGGGSIVAAVSFDYKTKDGARLIYFRYRLVDADGTRIVNETTEVNVKGSGTYNFSLALPTQTAQTYRFRVRLADECFSESKWAEVNYIVTQPTGLVDKTDYGVARLNGVFYLIGGRDASGSASDSLLRHDPVTGVTTAHASLPEARFSAAIASYDDLIFVFGGNAFGYEQDSTFVYNSATDSWSARAPMSRPTSGADAVVIDDLIYVVRDDQVEQYDPVTDIWNQVTVLPGPQ